MIPSPEEPTYFSLEPVMSPSLTKGTLQKFRGGVCPREVGRCPCDGLEDARRHKQATQEASRKRRRSPWSPWKTLTLQHLHFSQGRPSLEF